MIISLLTCLRPLFTIFNYVTGNNTIWDIKANEELSILYYQSRTNREYRMDKIELMTQPEKDSVSESPQERTLQKLKSLVSEYLADMNDEEEEENETEDKHKEHEETGKEKENEGDKNGHSHSHSHSQHKHSHDNVHQKNAKDVNEDPKTTQETTHEKEDDSVEYDDDGFVIPQGKIPLDGHFSTSEIKELIKLSKEEGILKEDVNIKVLDSNEHIGDKVVISEESDKDKLDNPDKEGKDDDSNGDKKDRSNSIDPKETAKQYGKKSESE